MFKSKREKLTKNLPETIRIPALGAIKAVASANRLCCGRCPRVGRE